MGSRRNTAAKPHSLILPNGVVTHDQTVDLIVRKSTAAGLMLLMTSNPAYLMLMHGSVSPMKMGVLRYHTSVHLADISMLKA